MGAAPIICFKCVALRDWAKCWRREEPDPEESQDWSRADVKRSKSRSVTSHRLPSTNGLVKRQKQHLLIKQIIRNYTKYLYTWMCTLPSCSQVAEDDPCSLLTAENTESSTTAAKQKSYCPHRPFQNPLSIQKTGTCSMSYVTIERYTNMLSSTSSHIYISSSVL